MQALGHVVSLNTEYVVITGTICDVNLELGKTGQLDQKWLDLENAKDKCAEVKSPFS